MISPMSLPGDGENAQTVAVIVNGPSRQSTRMARALALVTNTMSPASIGRGVLAGLSGIGENRWGGLTPAPNGSPVAGAVAPVAYPMGNTVAQPMAYPSTGQTDDYRSIAMLDMPKLGKLGWGS